MTTVEIKINHNDPNHAKIFQGPEGEPFDLDKFNEGKDPDRRPEPGEQETFSDVSNLAGCTHIEPELFLLQIDLDKGLADNYDIVRLNVNVKESELKTPKKHYNLFGMQYDPNTGYFYLSDSPIDMYIPLIDGKKLLEYYFREFLNSVASTVDPVLTDEDFTAALSDISSMCNNLERIDELFQKIKLFNSNKSKITVDNYATVDSVSLLPFVKKSIGSIVDNPLTEKTFLGSLMSHVRVQTPEQGEFNLAKEAEMETTGMMANGWLFTDDGALGPSLLKYATYYLKFFSLLQNGEMMSGGFGNGPVNSLIIKCSNAVNDLGGLDGHMFREYNTAFSTEVVENVETLNTNVFFNHKTRDYMKTAFTKSKLEHEGSTQSDTNPQIAELEDVLKNFESENLNYVSVANITDFTSFTEDPGLTGSSVIHESDVDDYNYLIDHLENHKSSGEISNLCFDSLAKSVRNVAESKVVKQDKTFENVLQTIQDKEGLIPKITFLTKQVAKALANLYQGLATKTFVR